MRAASIVKSRPATVSLVSLKAAHVVIFLLLSALIYWLAFGLTQRSIFQDEGISLLAAQGILDHGYPLLPSGFVYERGYLPNYLTAASMFVFGQNQFAIMLPAIIMGLGSLWIVYAFARDAIGKPWIGVFAVVILLSLQIQTLYATSPRMYMSLQFFTLLAAYSSWRGYVDGKKVFKPIAFVAAAAAMFSHDQGTALLLALPVSVLLATFALKRSLIRFLSVPAVAGFVALAVVAGFVAIYSPPNVTPLITADVFIGGGGPFGLRITPADWLDSGLGLRDFAGYGFGFIPVIVLASIALVRGRWRDIPSSALFMVSVVTVAALVTITGTSEVTERMWLFVLPFYALLAGMIASWLMSRYGDEVIQRISVKLHSARPEAARSFLMVSAAGLGAIFLAVISIADSPASSVFGSPCRGNNCDKEVKSHYSQLESEIASEDLVISSNPFVTDFYLGSVDGYLRDKVVLKKNETEHHDFLTDEYLGIPLYDHTDLDALLNSENRVWVITDERVFWISSDETLQTLENEYTIHLSDTAVTTYVNLPR